MFLYITECPNEWALSPLESHSILIRKELDIHLVSHFTFFYNTLYKWSLILCFWILPEIRDHYLPKDLVPYLETLLEIFVLCCTEIFIFWVFPLVLSINKDRIQVHSSLSVNSPASPTGLWEPGGQGLFLLSLCPAFGTKPAQKRPPVSAWVLKFGAPEWISQVCEDLAYLQNPLLIVPTPSHISQMAVWHSQPSYIHLNMFSDTFG